MRGPATIARMPEYSQVLDDIVQRIAHARSVPAHSRKPLRVRGGGSKDFFGAQLHGNLLETRGLQGIVSYEPTELVVTVRNGTTVGGLVAGGLSGPSRASVGATRDFVLGARFINGLGEHLTFAAVVLV